MERFSSLYYAPAETRRLLRERCSSYLYTPARNEFFRRQYPVKLPDELALQLFQNLTVEFDSERERARAAYSALNADLGEPVWDEIVAEGWVRIVWGRIFASFEMMRASKVAPSRNAVSDLLETRHTTHYRFGEAARDNTELARLIAPIEEGTLRPEDIGCDDPAWVAARLWDRSPAPRDRKALRLWLDRWGLLGWPEIIPRRAWGDQVGNDFVEVALSTLESISGIQNWAEKREAILQELTLCRGLESAKVESLVPRLPASLVDRAAWLDDHRVSNFESLLDNGAGPYELVRLIIADTRSRDAALAPDPAMRRLLDLAAERPELLSAVISHVAAAPVLLADLLLHPPLTALASLIIARWEPQSGGYERERIERDASVTKAISFADAASLLGYFIKERHVDPAEVASLLTWLHSEDRRVPKYERQTMLDTLRDDLVQQDQERLSAIFRALTASMPESGLGTPEFAAAVDVVDTGSLANSLDPAPLVKAYIASVKAAGYGLRADRITTHGAVSLHALASRAPKNLYHEFLYPIDLTRRLNRGTKGADEILDTFGIGRSIRAHVRILSRAVAGIGEAIPVELSDALASAVRSGAAESTQRDQVSAFSVRFDTEPFRVTDQNIAKDLGAALTALPNERRQQLVDAILQIDEPYTLAHLLLFTPSKTREQLNRRLTSLTPKKASKIHTITEIQARIQALLQGGHAALAAQYMAVEHGLSTLGRVAGREIAQLDATLHLRLLQKDWPAIASADVPQAIAHPDRAAAEEMVLHYRGLAALRDPEGHREFAVSAFADLAYRHPREFMYSANLFAARISALLGKDIFALLQGEHLLRARRALADIDRALELAQTLPDAEREMVSCNKALLLLAMGEPERAYDVLASCRGVASGHTVAAYRAVSFARTHLVAEAEATIDQAFKELGESEILGAARDHIRSGAPNDVSRTLVTRNERLQQYKITLWDISRMSAGDQAAVLQAPDGDFATFVLDQVRDVGASVVGIVPTTKTLDLDHHEDDVNTLMREFLRQRLNYINWSVGDQSKGGVTAKGNSGARDIVIEKGTAVLAVIEAVICNRPITQEWSRAELTSHFQKLLAYSTCNVFFHITYSYLTDPTSIIGHLRQSAKADVPDGFRFLSVDEIRATDSRPAGFAARYEHGSAEVTVNFLVFDLLQADQRAAAKKATATNPRNKTAKVP